MYIKGVRSENPKTETHMDRAKQALETSNKELINLQKRYEQSPTRANRLMVDYEQHINRRLCRFIEKHCK